jgi:4,5-DOPA dioxygenase extradiol
MANLMPAIFFGHGDPMNALSKNAYTDGWAGTGNLIPRPKVDGGSVSMLSVQIG